MTEMARPGENARSNQDHRQVVSTRHDTPHLVQGWRQCDHVGCVEPVARSVGAQYLCESHAAIILVPLVRKRLYDLIRIPYDAPVGLGRYDSPAYGWAPGWVLCGATIRCAVRLGSVGTRILRRAMTAYNAH
jgi:hypothetical protein